MTCVFIPVDGGIYLDTDVLVLAPVDDLLNHPMTMGQEKVNTAGYLGSSFFLTEAKSKFLCIWLFAFREYNPIGYDAWERYAIIAPGRVAAAYPHLIHLEPKRFFQPSHDNTRKIYKEFYDWSNNYILHMWNRAGDKALVPKSPSEIPPAQNITSTLQEVFRHIYFNETVIHARLRYSNSPSTAQSLPQKLATSSRIRMQPYKEKFKIQRGSVWT